jgi:hypothetical protein
MKLDRLNRGETLAAGSAVCLFISMFFDWFHEGYEQRGNILVFVNLFVGNRDAWQSLAVIPFILELTVAVAIGAGLLRAFNSEWKPAIPPSAAVTVLGGLSFGLILFRILEPPSMADYFEYPIHAEPLLGIYVGLAAAAGVACGGFWTMRRRGISLAKVVRSLLSTPVLIAARTRGER